MTCIVLHEVTLYCDILEINTLSDDNNEHYRPVVFDKELKLEAKMLVPFALLKFTIDRKQELSKFHRLINYCRYTYYLTLEVCMTSTCC